MNWRRGLAKKGIFKGLKGKVLSRHPLDKHTTFKIGGRAELFIEPADIADLKLAVTLAKKHKMPIFVIGAGSNLLVSDKGLKGICLRLSSPCFKSASVKGRCLDAGGGLTLRRLIGLAMQRGLSGIEFLAGIPGTVGGALSMNAGGFAKNIGELVEKARVMDYNGQIKNLNRRDLKFRYRRSTLAKYIILSATLKLAKGNKEEIQDNIKRNLVYRKKTQDNSLPNAGCIFKNPPGGYAGRLIELCGLKVKRLGGACVSSRHANFILNRKHAASSDVLKLISLIKKKVKHKFDINLEPEIKIWQ